MSDNGPTIRKTVSHNPPGDVNHWHLNFAIIHMLLFVIQILSDDISSNLYHNNGRKARRNDR